MNRLMPSSGDAYKVGKQEDSTSEHRPRSKKASDALQTHTWVARRSAGESRLDLE